MKNDDGATPQEISRQRTKDFLEALDETLITVIDGADGYTPDMLRVRKLKLADDLFEGEDLLD